MASKYTIRGVADMSQHDEALKKSASEVYKYEKQVKQANIADRDFSNTISRNIGSVTKFLGVIGGVAGAVDVFTKSMRHNQATSDAMDRAQAALNTTVNNFYYTLSSGDFSYFTNGLQSIVSKAKEAQIAIDQLGNTMMSYSIINAKAQNKMAKARAIYYDPNSTQEQKEKAKKDMEAATKELANATKVQIQDIGKVIRTTVAKDTNINSSFISDAMINQALEVNATQGRDKYKKAIETQYSDYQNELKKVQKKYTKYKPDSLGDSNPYITDTAAYNTELEKLNNTYAKAIVGHTLLSKYTDEELQNLTQQRVAAYNLDTQLQSLTATQERLNNKAFKTPKTQKTPKGNGSNGNATTLSIPTLSFDGLEEEIAYLKKRNEYIAKGSALWEEYKAKANPMAGNTDANNKALNESLNQFQETLNSVDIEGENFWKRQSESAAEFADNIGTIGQAFSSMGRSLKDLNWDTPVFDVLGTVGQAVANIALGYSQAMLKPKDPVSWLIFGATGLAEMLAMIAAIKNSTAGYASGGIIGGSTTIGDYNLARVNKGEMILNNREQTRMFNLLSGSGGYGTVSEGGSVQFRISGGDLVGVLNNHNRKMNKVI